MVFKKFWLGILALALVFTMTVIGCDDNDDESDLDFPGLTAGKPSPAVLAEKGLTEAELDKILSAASRAADSDYLGYFDDPDYNILWFFWKNKSKANHENMTTDLASMLGTTFSTANNANEYEWVAQADYRLIYNVFVDLILEDYPANRNRLRVVIPKNTLFVGFGNR